MFWEHASLAAHCPGALPSANSPSLGISSTLPDSISVRIGQILMASYYLCIATINRLSRNFFDNAKKSVLLTWYISQNAQFFKAKQLYQPTSRATVRPTTASGRKGLAHELPVGKASLHHGDNVVIGQARIRADADHVVDHQFRGGIGGGMGPQVVALGYESAPSLAVEM